MKLNISQNIKNSVTCDQARYIHAIWLPAALGLFATASFIYWLFYQLDASLTLNAWYAANILNIIYQTSYWLRFRSIGTDHAKARRCLYWSTINGFIAALIWALAVVFVLPEGGSIEQFIFILTLIIIAVSSIFSVGPHQPVFLSFFMGCMIPLIVIISLGETILVSYFFILLLIFSAFSSIVALLFSRMFLRSLELRFENLDLVQQLTIQKDVAESANLAKSRFLAAASHDLRQPMHALNLYLSAMAEQLTFKEGKLLNQARQCANTMEEMFKALLDISRLDAAVVKPGLTAFLIGPLLERIQAELEPEALAKGLELHFVPSRLIVKSDPVLVGRILRNLISNAVRYTEKGKILVGCRRQRDVINVFVIDTGIGIPKHKQTTIFEEFYQLGNPERDRSKGLGLGLAIVDRITKLLKINLVLKSTTGKGTSFHLQLPRSYTFVDTTTEPTNTNNLIHSFDGRIAAVVDDESEVLNATRALFETWGLKVFTANDGDELKRQLIENSIVPDILICDYRLRDNANGLDVINELREEFNTDIPAMLISGDTAAHRIREIETSGLLALHKPVQENELKSALHELIHARIL